MIKFSEFRLQTIGGTIMILFGVLHWVSSGTTAMFVGYVTDPDNTWVPIVRSLGALTLTLPIFWAVFSIKKELDSSNRWTRRHTVLSGLAIAFLMIYLLNLSISYGRYSPKIQPIGI
jgi:hypothetical protein